MDAKYIKLDKSLNTMFRCLIYAVGIIVLVVGILGYVYSYNFLKELTTQHESIIPKFIYMFMFLNLLCIGLTGLFTFFICGKKFNLKNVLIIIIGSPIMVLIMVGYLLSFANITNVYDVSIKLLNMFAVIAVFIGGMKTILYLTWDDVVKREKEGAITINRKELLEADPRYLKDGLYSADYESCLCFYNFLKSRHIPSIDLLGNSINSMSSYLTSRNISCFRNILNAIFMKDEKSYWHELSDFIHNYSSDQPVSYDEYILFNSIFDYGQDIWIK
jgi:hypothetical protein